MLDQKDDDKDDYDRKTPQHYEDIAGVCPILNKVVDFLLGLKAVQEDLATTPIHGESPLLDLGADDSVLDWDVGEDETHVLL